MNEDTSPGQAERADMDVLVRHDGAEIDKWMLGSLGEEERWSEGRS